MKLGNRLIGPTCRPYIIAEMSGNHNQSLEKALQIVELAAECGVDALKIQTYTADTITLNAETDDFVITNPNSLWKGRTLYDLYQEAHTPWDWHEAIFKRAEELGVTIFSSPFDETAVDFLESLNAPFYKIASFENVHLPLIKKVAQTGKPIIMSTGMASVTELAEAVATARDNGCKELVLLKCTSNYPASPENSHVATIPHMRTLFSCEVGLSDHTLGIGAAIAAVALGATVIEKHFTTSRAEGGVDSAFSLEPAEMKALVVESERAWQAIGSVSYGPTALEKPAMKSRRSIYIAKDVRAGEVLTPENVRVVRPGMGLAPKYYEFILGKRIKQDAALGTALNWDLLLD